MKGTLSKQLQFLHMLDWNNTAGVNEGKEKNTRGLYKNIHNWLTCCITFNSHMRKWCPIRLHVPLAQTEKQYPIMP